MNRSWLPAASTPSHDGGRGAAQKNTRSGRLAGLAIVFASLTPFAAANNITSVPMVTPDVVFRSVSLGPANPHQVINIALSLNPADPEGLQAFADDVSNPDSPNYLKFITPAEVGQKFGVDQSTVNAEADYLAKMGFKITRVSKNRMAILATGTIGQAQKAFNTRINNYQTLSENEPGNRNFFSFATPPKLPTNLAKYVVDIEGLQSFTKPKPRTTLTPSMTQVLYNIAPIYNSGALGDGRTIGISNWDGFRVSNVPIFYTTYGLPAPAGGAGSNVTVVPIDGGSGTGGAGGEGDLDIQMGLSCSPHANLIVYDGGAGPVTVITTEADDDAADIISESWGWNIDASTANALHNQHVSMTAQGITYMIASGDFGTSLEPFSYPNYEPEVLIVGGTIATTDSTGNRQSEVGWAGSGGGWVTKGVAFNTLPAFQVGNGVPTNINYRLGPDVSLHAASDTGAYNFIYGGSVSAGDGTSFSSPTFASNLAAVEHQLIIEGKLPLLPSGKRRLGRIQDVIYKQNGRSDVWTDIVSGNNGTLPDGSSSNATIAWDFVTGFGVPNFDAFEKSLVFVPPLRILPKNATLFQKQGTGTSGSFHLLPFIDQQYFSVTSKNETGIGQIAAAHIVFKLQGDVSKLSSLIFTINGYAASSTSGYVYLYNYTTGTYDLIKNVGLSANSKTFSVTAKNARNYVNGTKKVQMVFRAVKPSRLGTNVYQLNLDQTVVDEIF